MLPRPYYGFVWISKGQPPFTFICTQSTVTIPLFPLPSSSTNGMFLSLLWEPKMTSCNKNLKSLWLSSKSGVPVTLLNNNSDYFASNVSINGHHYKMPISNPLIRSNSVERFKERENIRSYPMDAPSSLKQIGWAKFASKAQRVKMYRWVPRIWCEQKKLDITSNSFRVYRTMRNSEDSQTDLFSTTKKLPTLSFFFWNKLLKYISEIWNIVSDLDWFMLNHLVEIEKKFKIEKKF